MRVKQITLSSYTGQDGRPHYSVLVDGVAVTAEVVDRDQIEAKAWSLYHHYTDGPRLRRQPRVRLLRWDGDRRIQMELASTG